VKRNSKVQLADMASPNWSPSTSSAGKSPTRKSATGLSSLPPDAKGPISAALGRTIPATGLGQTLCVRSFPAKDLHAKYSGIRS